MNKTYHARALPGNRYYVTLDPEDHQIDNLEGAVWVRLPDNTVALCYIRALTGNNGAIVTKE